MRAALKTVKRTKRRKDDGDFPTPMTDKLIGEMLCGRGIPKCEEWDRLAQHARDMERMAYCYRVVAGASMKTSELPRRKPKTIID